MTSEHLLEKKRVVVFGLGKDLEMGVVQKFGNSM